MYVLLTFAFLAGLFTVLSPCILPVLPVILASSTSRGKWHPLGTILGLTLSFALFTLTLHAIVQAIGISATSLRYFAIALIFLFGLFMLLPKLGQWFATVTAPIANAGESWQRMGRSEGFWSGLIFGAALGLLWTPCAGPILAAVTTLVATQTVNGTVILMTLAYSLGAGIPLFFIAYGGSKILHSSKFLSSHSERIRQFFGVLTILVAIMLALNWDMIVSQKLTSYLPESYVENNPRLQKELENLRGAPLPKQQNLDQLSDFGQAPALAGIAHWINSNPLTFEQLKGKVVLIDFWTYSCINCLRTLPYIKQWDKDYKNRGLVIIGVHTPEFEFEKDLNNVESAVKRLGITYPVALDNDYQTWLNYNNHYWPAHYLIDQQGNIRLVHFGEGGYIKMENSIRELLGMQPMDKKEQEKRARLLTKETYLGEARGNSYTKQIVIKPDQAFTYDYFDPLEDDEVGLRGSWLVTDEYIESKSNVSFIELNFLAKQVYLVLAGSSQTPIMVYLDDQPVGRIFLNGDRKYDIVNANYGRHLLSLKIPLGVKAYAFTFGDE